MSSADPFLPADIADISKLRDAAKECHGCDLFARATQTVFGDGDDSAQVMLVGEQPGDQEDRQGTPFVGPAGDLLDRALSDAGLDRSSMYVTNAVKHFKWEARGKVRLHKNPSAREIAACRPWLLAEIAAVRPSLVVCLGATAARSLLGAEFRVTKGRGKVLPGPDGFPVLATVHPASILRVRNHDERDAAFQSLVRDLQLISAERHAGKK